MWIKNVIPLQLKCYFRCLISNKSSWKDFVEHIDENKRKIVVALAADYGNLGDVAITIAQEEFLRKNFPEYQIIDFPIAMTYTHMKSLKAVIKEDDIITLVGGGNMGDLYSDIEACRQFVIKQFPKNRIVSFPQTIFFEKQENLEKCVRVYSKHPKLTIAARELFSYTIMNDNFNKANILLTPDIVLSMKPELEECVRDKILLIIRNDKEGILSEPMREKIIEALKNTYNAETFDTVIKTDRMSVKERQDRLRTLLMRINSSSVVVTNRLHGMIFCAITGTPCVVLPIKGDKIKGVLQLVGELNYIKYCPSYDLEVIQQTVAEVQKSIPNMLNLDVQFEPLLKAIR